MKKNPSPKEAFEYFKALSPEVTGISKQGECNCVVQIGKAGHQWIEFVTIDWGDLTQWPPKEPPRKWRWARMPEDWGKPCRVWDDDGDMPEEGILNGLDNDSDDSDDYRWIAIGEWWRHCQVEDTPEQTETPPPNYMLEALRFALNVLEKGIEVRIQDSWPALKAILPETIQKVKDAIERAEADLGAQKQPSSVAKIQAEAKAVARELENVGGSEQAPTKSLVARFCELRYPELGQKVVLQTMAGLLMQDLKIWKQLLQHPADREPTDEEVERAALIYDPQINGYGQEFACFKAKDDVKCALKAWQQVWRDQK